MAAPTPCGAPQELRFPLSQRCNCAAFGLAVTWPETCIRVGTSMRARDDILLVGGYGVVGRRIAARLAPEFASRLVIAGRNTASAEALCRELGGKPIARHIDVRDRMSIDRELRDVGTVVSCVAQPTMDLLRESVVRGLAYADISPRLAHSRVDERWKKEAVRTGARVVLGAGLSPGISNLMARKLSTDLGGCTRVETDILLSLGDEYGPDSLHHVFGSIVEPFEVFVDGRSRKANAFCGGTRVAFPRPVGTRVAYPFPWSDVVSYPVTLQARTSLGRFALDPPWLGRAASLIVRSGASAWLAGSSLAAGRSGVIERLKRRYAGRDAYALVVRVTGPRGARRMSLVGTRQAAATAAGAAAIIQLLASGIVSDVGVFLPESVIPEGPFFEQLATWGYVPEYAEELNETL